MVKLVSYTSFCLKSQNLSTLGEDLLYHRLGGLNNRNLSQFWRLGCPRSNFQPVRFLVFSSRLADGHLLSVLSRGLSSVHGERESERSDPSSYKATNPMRLWPHPHDFIYLYFLGGSISYYSNIGG